MPSTVALQLGADGKLAYDVILKQNSEKRIIYSTPEAAEGIDDNKVVVSTSSGIQVVKRVRLLHTSVPPSPGTQAPRLILSISLCIHVYGDVYVHVSIPLYLCTATNLHIFAHVRTERRIQRLLREGVSALPHGLNRYRPFLGSILVQDRSIDGWVA